ncbi:MAG: copper-binding protein [Syntrophales bacterium]|nr:copper-binding protein [Syntrophales bacterium]
MKKQFAFWQCALMGMVLGAGSAAAFGQSVARPDPADPGASAPEVIYRSAFSNYQPYVEQEPASWTQINEEVTGIPGAAGHAGHTAAAMNASPEAPAVVSSGHEGHAAMAMPEPAASSPSAEPMAAPPGAIVGTGVIQQIDKANAKVKITHDPIAALGWPRMIMFFRLKYPALADGINEGDKVDFYLEKSSSGYAISGFRKSMTRHDMGDAPEGEKK